MTKLFEALAGYDDPGGGGTLAGGPAILGGAGAGSDHAFEERTEAQFDGILNELERQADADTDFAKKMCEAFGVEPDLGRLKQELRRARGLVEASKMPRILGPGGGANLEGALDRLGLNADSRAAAGVGASATLGAPKNFSATYVADHLDARYREDPQIDLQPDLKRYEDDSAGGLIGWLLFNGVEAIRVPRKSTPPFTEQFGRISGAQKFRRHSGADPFVYELREPTDGRDTRVALFADFGTGLGHTLFIARQMTVDRFEAGVHLGDVYYTGTPKQYRENFENPLAPVMDSGTELFVIPDNHDGYSGFHAYCDFIDRRTRQRGSYFALLTKHVQFLGVDTIWHSDRGRLQDDGVRAWLRERFVAGRASGRANVLMTGHEPYAYGKDALQDLNQDVVALADGALDLWFWGNTHYGALFDRTASTPYYGSCIGHAGYPYAKQVAGQATPAPVLFLETGSRYEGTDVRPDRGMNGFCAFEITPDGGVSLRYLDWRGTVRHVARFAKQANHALRMI